MGPERALVTSGTPVHTFIMHHLLWPLFSAKHKIHWGLVPRPHYAYCLYQAARLAKLLGVPRISALEFGVAGGNGLVVIEQHARWIQRELGVHVEIYGFDTGEGLPEPEDYRDVPYAWKAGFFKMDRPALERRLEVGQLVIGNVRDTGRTFFDRYKPAPVGCVFHDLDFYSSTRDALTVLEAASEHFLPRVFHYFDDIIGSDLVLQNEYVGQRRAIMEFNEGHAHKKITNCYQFYHRKVRKKWHRQIFVLHDFLHPQYDKFIETDNQQLPLDG
jgi:hypothetical protein